MSKTATRTPAPRSRARSRAALAVLLALLPLLAGCGWKSGLVVPPHAGSDAESVGVEIFTPSRSRVLVRDLEPLLHRELTRAVSDLVGLPIRAPERADLVVRGRIIEYRRRGGIRRANTGGATRSRNDLLETAVRIVISGELVDRRSGRVLHPATNAAVSSAHAVGPDEEENARDRALRNVSEALVLDLFLPSEGDSEPNSAQDPE